MESPRPVQALAAPASDFQSPQAIEAYLDSLNQRSPMAQRDIIEWGPASVPRMQIRPVPTSAIVRPGEMIFMAESQASFGLDVRARRSAALGSPFVVGLVLSGTMRVTLASGEFEAQAGEGVIIDPADVERTQFSVNSHFVEFALPKTNLLRLGAELAPGELAGVPEFAPVLPSPLARRLLFMAGETAQLLRGADGGRARGGLAGTRLMYERWMEMIALSLLREQQPAHPAPAALEAGAPPPRALSRALDFIDAHVHSDILLADIASAACVSVSSLLRLFNEHVGQSPGAFLRQLRLDRARAELRSGWSGSIRELGQRWGFQNARKFSQAYLQRFGERPSDGRGAVR